MPYEPGPKVISRDDQGDPVYEDAGLTPRFIELTRKVPQIPRRRPAERLTPVAADGDTPRMTSADTRTGLRWWWRTATLKEWALAA